MYSIDSLTKFNPHNAAAPANQMTSEQPVYAAEQYAVTAPALLNQWETAVQATSASAEYAAAEALVVTIDALKAAVVSRLAALKKKANDEAAIEQMKQQLANGVTDIEALIASLTAHRAANVKAGARKQSRSDPDEPKVHAFLAVPDHNDFKWGYSVSLRNLDSSKPGYEWAKKLPDGKADSTAFRKAEQRETEEMTRRRDAYRASKQKK